MQFINTQVKQTTRGHRVWIEGSKLSSAGFHPNTRFNMHYNEFDKLLELTVHPEGKRKVSNSKRGGKDRPIIDIESKKIGAFFGVNAPLTVLLMDGKAHVFRRPSWQNLENRLNEFLAVIDKRTKGDHWGVSLAPDFNPKRWAVASGFALQS